LQEFSRTINRLRLRPNPQTMNLYRIDPTGKRAPRTFFS
jgi:hypothetical protein